MTQPESYFDKLVDLMDTLREPGGCPWDREQTRETLKPMLIEEAYEVLEALDSEDSDDICEELGDLLFQVIFHSRIGKEREEFDAYEVCRRVYKKMVGRHPHVFADARFADSQELLKHWEEIKAAEKERAGTKKPKESLLDGIPESLPAIYVTYQMTSKASRIGFDWDNIEGVREKVLEEFEELQEAVRSENHDRVKEEVGDLLFAALNIARHLQIDPETALKGANSKFLKRFQAMEGIAKRRGKALRELSLEEMEVIWEEIKRSTVGEPQG